MCQLLRLRNLDQKTYPTKVFLLMSSCFFRTILITGASGGLGSELARLYAAPETTLILWGRNAERLNQTAENCRKAGATVLTRTPDLTNPKEAIAALRDDDDQNPIDLLILNAGVSDIRRGDQITEPAETVLLNGLVNFTTPSSMAMAAAERMVARGGGTIALVGSVAAYHDLPFSAGYCGSKAGLARFAESARIALKPFHVYVSYIAPAFIDTDMSRRLTGPRPFLMTAEAAAGLIVETVRKRRPVYIFPWPFRFLRILAMILPRFIRELIMKNMHSDQKPRNN
jgi:short-subunit dehydrogenase